MKNIVRKLSLWTFLGLVVVSMSIMNVAATPQGPNQTNVGGNQHQGTIAGNTTNQYMFQNRFQFQLRVNQTLDVDIDCDDPLLADRSFEMDLNTSECVRVEMNIRSENSDIGLTNGSRVQNRNRNQYRYQEQFMINVSLNESCQVQARLAINSEDSNATWAYYDEENEEFIPVESHYENGMVVANTDHFSLWTVLTYDDEDSSTVPGFALFAAPTLLGVIGLYAILKKSHK